MVGQYVEDEAFLDGLLHGVRVERQVLDGAVGLGRCVAEQFEGLVLWRRREGEVAGVVQQPSAFDDPVDAVLEGVVIIGVSVGVRVGIAQ